YQLITIQTKLDTFMAQNKDAASANQAIQELLDDFEESYFTNMVFKGYKFSANSFDDNVKYIDALPELEKEQVDSWIQDELNNKSNTSRSELFKEKYRGLIGIDTVREQIQQLWLKVSKKFLELQECRFTLFCTTTSVRPSGSMITDFSLYQSVAGMH